MSCSETRAVEALYDGRLPPEEGEALRLHLVTCAVCSNEAARFERLSSNLAALPEPDPSKERVDAGRRRLLDSARRLGQKPSIPVGRMAGFALAACAAVMAASFGLERARLRSHELVAGQAAAAAASELVLTLTPAAGTTWSRASSERAETVHLADGELGVEVSRHGSGRRLLVTLPDGELEDVGTVFSVEVHAGKTRAVSVSQGRVALRLRGRSELLLSAGESFHAPDEEAGRAPSTPPPSTSGTSTPAASEPAPNGTSATHQATRSGARPTSTNDEAHACPSAALFQDGVQAFKRGEYTTAATLLDRFSSACGRGNHGEDAAYLRMVALARAGRRVDARAQAAAYLSAFPNGFRRKEAEKLVAAP
jgi:anti-sigma factor RsiW